MRTIIAGSRTITSITDVEQAVDNCGWRPTTILSGAAKGVDQLGEVVAMQRGIPLERYPANWTSFGKAAGYRRNVQMADKAEALIAVWDGVSRGTKHMIDIANERKLRVYVHMVR